METTPVRFLIAVNASKTSEAALKWYLEHLHLPNHQITLLFVSDEEFYPTFGYRANIPKQKQHETFAEGDKLMKAIKKKHEDIVKLAGVEESNFRFVCKSGSPGPTITETVEHTRANAVVLGRKSSHHASLSRTLLGSVSDHVLHHSQVTVCVCPAEYAQ